MDWTLRSVEYAFSAGSKSCTIIPTRSGNGIMEVLQEDGHYVPPSLRAVETVFEKALDLAGGRVFVDLWDLERFSHCPNCFKARKERLESMNTHQRLLPGIACTCKDGS